MNEFWAIILAAGESKRMGFPKMLLPFNGRTMIENVIANVTESKVDKIMVVLGASRDAPSTTMILSTFDSVTLAITFSIIVRPLKGSNIFGNPILFDSPAASIIAQNSFIRFLTSYYSAPILAEQQCLRQSLQLSWI